MVGGALDDEGILEEGRVITGQKAVDQPTQEAWDHHIRAHMPVGEWYASGVKGLASQVHIREPDNLQKRSRMKCHLFSENIAPLPTLVGVDRKSAQMVAHMVPKNGHDPSAIKIISNHRNKQGGRERTQRTTHERDKIHHGQGILEGGKGG